MKKVAQPKLTLASNVSWVNRALKQAPADVIITSPYLTGPTALNIIRRTEAATAVILTRFEAELFASGASHLQVIKKLLAEGYKFLCLKDVHAKLLSTKGAIFVGSQNLTVAGTRNKEATGWVSDQGEVLRIRQQLKAWIADAQEISPEMVIDMEKRVALLRPHVKAIFEKLGAADIAIEEAERGRIKNRQREAEAEERRAAKVRRRRQAKRYAGLQKAVQASAIVDRYMVQLVKIPSQAKFSFTPPHWSLRAAPDVDMTKWSESVSGDNWVGVKRNRYLVIVDRLGRLGWTALQKRLLTGFCTSVRKMSDDFGIEGNRFEVDLRANDDAETLSAWNLEFTLRSEAFKRIAIRGAFSLDGFKVDDLVTREEGLIVSSIRKQLENARGRLAIRLCSLAITPFKYERNGAIDVGTKEFCKELPSSLILKLRSFHKQPIFSLEPKYPDWWTDDDDDEENL